VYYDIDAYGNSNITIGRAFIQDNLIDNCDGNGIYLYTDLYNDTGATISLGNPIISDNTISNNGHGTYLVATCNATITRNMFINNTAGRTGLHVDADSHDNEIHQNCFIDNEPQAHDSGLRNDWDGNFWSDYTGPLSPYPIPDGSSGSQDNGPLGYCPLGIQPICGVGGDLLPVDKIGLLLPYIAMVLSAAVLMTFAMIGSRYRRKRQG